MYFLTYFTEKEHEVSHLLHKRRHCPCLTKQQTGLPRNAAGSDGLSEEGSQAVVFLGKDSL